jgi:hypothetical protein
MGHSTGCQGAVRFVQRHGTACKAASITEGESGSVTLSVTQQQQQHVQQGPAQQQSGLEGGSNKQQQQLPPLCGVILQAPVRRVFTGTRTATQSQTSLIHVMPAHNL